MTGFTETNDAKTGQLSVFKRLQYRLAEFPEGVVFFTMLVLFIFFTLTAEHFTSGSALSNILTFASINGVIVVGVTTLMIAGEFDLSVGSIFAVSSYVFAITINSGYDPFIALIAALAASLVLGAINGWLVIQWEIPSLEKDRYTCRKNGKYC